MRSEDAQKKIIFENLQFDTNNSKKFVRKMLDLPLFFQSWLGGGATLQKAVISSRREFVMLKNSKKWFRQSM